MAEPRIKWIDRVEEYLNKRGMIIQNRYEIYRDSDACSIGFVRRFLYDGRGQRVDLN